MNADMDSLVGVEEIGEKIAQSVIHFFSIEKNNELVHRLRSYGVQLEISADQLANQSDVLSGNTFVVSGVFNSVSRTELKKLIEDNGGKVSGSISGKTSYVVAGENMGPSKRTKAESLGVPIISEEDFLNMIK